MSAAGLLLLVSLVAGILPAEASAPLAMMRSLVTERATSAVSFVSSGLNGENRRATSKQDVCGSALAACTGSIPVRRIEVRSLEMAQPPCRARRCEFNRTSLAAADDRVLPLKMQSCARRGCGRGVHPAVLMRSPGSVPAVAEPVVADAPKVKRKAASPSVAVESTPTALPQPVAPKRSKVAKPAAEPSTGNAGPLGFQLMCLQQPKECEAGGASQVAASASIMATLKRVNTKFNNSIAPRNDKGADVWTVNATAGDCEDYVLAKRHALIAAGLPPSALRIAYVKTRSGEDHAILVVKTDNGSYVLDNLNRAVRPLSQSGYRLISMSGANPQNWS